MTTKTRLWLGVFWHPQGCTVQYNKVPDSRAEGVAASTSDSSDGDGESGESVAGGGGRDNTDSTVPLTRVLLCPLSLSPPARRRWYQQWAPMAWQASQLPRVRARGMP